jgi:hypothetical protein
MGFGARPGVTKLSELTIDTSKDWLAYQIHNLLDPSLAQDAATKAYVDAIPPGISALSELEIDTSKDWLTYLIKNIGDAVDDQDALALHQGVLQSLMTTFGDVIYRGASKAARLAPDAGIGYNFLRSRGPGMSPVWTDIMSLITYLTGAKNVAIELDLSIDQPVITLTTGVGSSPPGKTAETALSIAAPTVAKAASSQAGGNAVGGAIAYDDSGPTFTDETAQANDATANDMTLLPATPAVNDAYYFGYASLWNWLNLKIGTAGAGTWTITWEYWNGSAWTALSGIYDTANGFRASGMNSVAFRRPDDWTNKDVNGVTLYWIRGRVSSYTSKTTQPLGTQAWIGAW